MNIEYRRGVLSDLTAIREFVDWWLAGRAMRKGTAGASNDYFVSTRQHSDYLKWHVVWLALDNRRIIGWAVRSKLGVLTHLLVAADYRGQGIGTELLRILDPGVVRSKSDQGTGDPIEWYKKRGYVKASDCRVGKRQNIDVLFKISHREGRSRRTSGPGPSRGQKQQTGRTLAPGRSASLPVRAGRAAL